MQLIPLIYLKNGKAVRPSDTRAAWFQDNAEALSFYFDSQGAKALYLNDLNIPLTGKSENFSAVQAIRKNLKSELWVSGNFRSLSTIEAYADLGIDKIVLGGSVYQDPNLLRQATQKFPQKIGVQIEVKNKKVVIPGMVAPTHKSVQDYASRFEQEGAAALCYSEATNEGLREFCAQAKVPVLNLQEIQNVQELEKLSDCADSKLIGVVVGRSLYASKIDLHSAIAFLNDLTAAKI